MFSPLELYIGLRYTRARRRTHFISFITVTSIVGITLGVMALITILSVMNGFEKEVRERILSLAAHVTVSAWSGPLPEWRQTADELEQHPHVVASAPYIRVEGMLTHAGEARGVLVRGVQPEQEAGVSEIGAKMLQGAMADLVDGEYRILLGEELARNLGARVGDKVTLVIPKASVTPAGVVPRLRRFTVSGIFKVGVFEYDSVLAVVHIGDAARLFRYGDGVTGIRLRLDDLYAAQQVRAELQEQMPAGVQLQDWSDLNRNWFHAVRTEKRIMFIVVSLVLAVAAFNIVSTLVMVVRDKESDIAILRTLGATPRSIMTIFVIQGTVIGLAGTVLGVLFGIALALNVETIVPAIEQMFNVRFLPPDVYYISELPSDLRGADVLRISFVAFALTVLATLYPAWRAAKTHPAEALRYE